MMQTTLGVILGNRDFFPDHLISSARNEIMSLLDKLQINAIILDENETSLGDVMTLADAHKCADLFKKNRDVIDGILVVLPNFGDEKGITETIKLSGLNVPVLIQGYPDNQDKLDVVQRRDAYCGKISVCNNLVQAGIPFTLTQKHVVAPDDITFTQDLQRFSGICRVVNGLSRARIGAIGARPGAFNTVRYSEKILEANGISVTTVDLSEILGHVNRMSDSDAGIKSKLEEITAYAGSDGVPSEKMIQMAKLGLAIDDFMEANRLDASAIQCWNSLQANAGINVCTNMSLMSEKLMPSACEVDVMGALSMYALQLASCSPSALADWNNNYEDKEDHLVLFHCGNWAKSLVPDQKISTAPILGSTLGVENTYGALEGRAPKAPLTFARLSTNDMNGTMQGYVGQGQLTDDVLDTFGTRAVAHIPRLETLMHLVCEAGFEHHVAINPSHVSGILTEAFEKYLGWDIYTHPCE